MKPEKKKELGENGYKNKLYGLYRLTIFQVLFCFVPKNLICTSPKPHVIVVLIVSISPRQLINRSQVTWPRSLVIVDVTTSIWMAAESELLTIIPYTRNHSWAVGSLYTLYKIRQRQILYTETKLEFHPWNKKNYLKNIFKKGCFKIEKNITVQI